MQRPQPLPADAARETEQLLRGEDTAEEGGCCGVVACLGGMGQLGIVDALLHSEPEPPPIGVSAKPLQSDRSRANMINDWLTVKDDHTGSVVRPPYTHSLPDSTVVKGSRVDREARFIFLFSWFVTNLATTVHTGTTSCVKRTRQLSEYMGLSEYSILLLASSVGIYSTPLLESMALLLIAVNYSHRQHLEAILVARVAAGALHEEVDPISGERIYVETAPVDHPARRRCWTLAAETMDDYKSAGGCNLNFEAMEAAARKDPLGCMAFVLHLLPSSSGGREAIAFAGNPSDIAHGRILAGMMRAKYEVLMNKAYSSEVALQEHLDVIAKAVRETPVPDFAVRSPALPSALVASPPHTHTPLVLLPPGSPARGGRDWLDVAAASREHQPPEAAGMGPRDAVHAAPEGGGGRREAGQRRLCDEFVLLGARQQQS